MKEWMDLKRDNYFSVDRNPHIVLPNGFTIVPDRNISDFTRRSWIERLFSRPWKPLQATKPDSKAYIIEKTILVSWATFAKIKLESRSR